MLRAPELTGSGGTISAALLPTVRRDDVWMAMPRGSCESVLELRNADVAVHQEQPTGTVQRDEGESMTTLENRPNTALLVVDVQNGVVAGAHERDAVVANVGSL